MFEVARSFGIWLWPYMVSGIIAWAILAPILRWHRRRRTSHHLREIQRVSEELGLYDDE